MPAKIVAAISVGFQLAGGVPVQEDNDGADHAVHPEAPGHS
jgi:hypothetical protein